MLTFCYIFGHFLTSYNNNNGWHVVQRTVVPMATLGSLPLPAWALEPDEDGYQEYKCSVCLMKLGPLDTRIGRLACDHVVCYECLQE